MRIISTSFFFRLIFSSDLINSCWIWGKVIYLRSFICTFFLFFYLYSFPLSSSIVGVCLICLIHMYVITFVKINALQSHNVSRVILIFSNDSPSIVVNMTFWLLAKYYYGKYYSYWIEAQFFFFFFLIPLSIFIWIFLNK